MKIWYSKQKCCIGISLLMVSAFASHWELQIVFGYSICKMGYFLICVIAKQATLLLFSLNVFILRLLSKQHFLFCHNLFISSYTWTPESQMCTIFKLEVSRSTRSERPLWGAALNSRWAPLCHQSQGGFQRTSGLKTFVIINFLDESRFDWMLVYVMVFPIVFFKHLN